MVVGAESGEGWANNNCCKRQAAERKTGCVRTKAGTKPQHDTARPQCMHAVQALTVVTKGAQLAARSSVMQAGQAMAHAVA